MTPILVTGGAGYIGSHACKALARAGYLPVAYDNLCRGFRWAVRWGPLEIGDIADRSALSAVLRRYRPAAVMHFAGYAYVGESVAEPGLYYANNVSGTQCLLEAMRAEDIAQLIFSSSCSIYGADHERPVAEDAPWRPVSPYAETKAAVERILQDRARAYGLRSVALRYFNASGADPDGEIGEAHDPETHFIPLMLRAAAGRSEPLQIFGDDYPTADGTCVRDYVHVTDLAEAHVAALRWLGRSAGSGAFNVGTGRGHSLRQVLNAAREVTGREIPHLVGPRRAGDPPYAVGDVSLARRVLGWSATQSTLEHIIRTGWDWQERHYRRVAAAAS